MENNDDIFAILYNIGLEDDEIRSINKRNKLLNQATAEEVNEIVDFLGTKCALSNNDVARIVIKNPFILNESFDRINALSMIYKKIGFLGEEYKEYLSNYEKAFSLNPKEVADYASRMLSAGKTNEDIRKMLLNEANKIF